MSQQDLHLAGATGAEAEALVSLIGAFRDHLAADSPTFGALAA